MTDVFDRELKRIGVTVPKLILAIIAIIFGLVVIVFPDLLGWIVGIYLIIQGVLFIIEYIQSRRF
jgi:uncharacterized membrane protein HdeD (DUF308 family)